jgi:xylulokinase
VFAGIGDGQAGGLALNILKPGECYLSLGTSVVSGTYWEQYLTSRHFRTMFAGSRGGYSLETVILGGTYTVDWFLRLFGREYSLSDLEVGINSLPEGAGD